MKNYDIEKEIKRYPKEYGCKVFEEKHGDGEFLMRNALLYMIDSYDDAISSVELSHYEKLDYNEVVNFDLPETADTLDLTWMDENDSFVLDKSEQIYKIDEIIANIDNIGYSYLPIDSKNDKKFIITIKGENAKKKKIQQIKDFKHFVEWNFKYIKKINIEGFTPIMEAILSSYIKRLELDNENSLKR